MHSKRCLTTSLVRFCQHGCVWNDADGRNADMYQDVVATALAWYVVVAYALITGVAVRVSPRLTIPASPPILTRAQASTEKMFSVLGPHWIMTLVGCVAVMLVPVPVLLRRCVWSCGGKASRHCC